MQTLIQIGVFPANLQSQIDAEFHCISPETALADEALRSSVRGLITRSNAQVPQTVLEALPALQVVATSGVGYDGIPVAYAQQRGIVVTHTPGVLDAAVCELGMGLLLALLREIPQSDRYTREGSWRSAGPYPLTSRLAGKRIGIVGLGRIGKGMAARLAPFEPSLIAYSGTRPQADVPYRFFPTALALAAEVDVLIVCCQGGAETHRLINVEVLQALGAGWLLNISRGTVVDETALYEALTTGALRGAALDVFEQEPVQDASPLLTLGNVILSPHSGSATSETRADMLRLTLDNLHAVLTGREALTAVPPQKSRQ